MDATSADVPGGSRGGSNSQNRLGGSNPRGYKEMIDVVKKLLTQSDDIQEKLCTLYARYAEITLKAALLFDPVTVQIMDDREIPENILTKEQEPMTRESVNDAYIELSQVLSQRPNSDPDLRNGFSGA